MYFSEISHERKEEIRELLIAYCYNIDEQFICSEFLLKDNKSIANYIYAAPSNVDLINMYDIHGELVASCTGPFVSECKTNEIYNELNLMVCKLFNEKADKKSSAIVLSPLEQHYFADCDLPF